MTYLLGELGGATIIKSAQKAADIVSGQWDNAWGYQVSSSGAIYQALAHLGLIFALASLMIWGIWLLRNYLDTGHLTFVPELIWPLVVVSFLKDGGAMLATISVAIRNMINQANSLVLTSVSGGIEIQVAYQQVKNNVAARTQIAALLKQCQGQLGQKQIDCLKTAQEQAKEIVTAYHLSGGWIDDLLTELGKVVSNPAGEIANGAFALFGTIMGAAQEGVAIVFLVSLQVAFQALLEVSLIFTAMLGPMALGLSLLPVGAKPIYAWLTAMFSVGIAKLCFNIVVGVVATAVVNADTGNELWFLIFVSVLAPFVSIALASGGGMAVWSSFTSAGAWGLKVVYENQKSN